MTPIAGFFIAVIAGWLVREPRKAAATVILPYLAIVAVQTWYIANGYGTSPPDTVTPFSGAISYWVVQAIFLITTVAIAAEVAVLRAGARAGQPMVLLAGPWYRAAVATAICTIGTLVLLVGWLASAKLVSQHSSAGSPPPQGLIGIGLSVIGIVAFGVAAIRTLVRTRRQSMTPAAGGPAPPELDKQKEGNHEKQQHVPIHCRRGGAGHGRDGRHRHPRVRHVGGACGAVVRDRGDRTRSQPRFLLPGNRYPAVAPRAGRGYRHDLLVAVGGADRQPVDDRGRRAGPQSRRPLAGDRHPALANPAGGGHQYDVLRPIAGPGRQPDGAGGDGTECEPRLLLGDHRHHPLA